MRQSTDQIVFIFDWDGTLLDVSNQILFALEHGINDVIAAPDHLTQFPILSHLQPVSKTALLPFLGHRFKETILPALYPEVCCDENLVTLFYQKFLSHYASQQSSLFSGVDDFLRNLQKRCGCALALATNKSRSLLLRELDQHNLASLFDCIVCGDDPCHGGRTKPQPDMLNTVQSNFPSASSYYMIGDSPADILAAKTTRHPTFSVAVLNNSCPHSSAQIHDTQPDKILQRAELSDYLHSILQAHGNLTDA